MSKDHDSKGIKKEEFKYQSQVTIDGEDLTELLDKYPAVNREKLEKTIIDKCKYYSGFSQDDLESKYGFENGQKHEFLEGVKDTILLRQFDYKKPKEKKLKKESNKKREEYRLIWEKDLKDIEEIETEWLIERLIPPKSVGVWTGKRGTMKTFLVLNAVCCSSKGLNFLGQYPTKEIKVLYLDKENGTAVLKQRLPMIKKGLSVEENLPIAFVCFSTFRLDNPYDIAKLEKIIVENDFNLLVVDTYRRAIGFDENSAGDVSFLFVNTLRPLVERHNVSIILIHHDKKGISPDEMDSIRGSSDLANYSDFILKNERKGKNLVLKQLKCRNAPEIEPIFINVETDESTFIKFNSTGKYEPQTKENKAFEILTLWITNEKLKSFTTKEAKKVANENGIKKQNFYNALDSLQNLGIISKRVKGVYDVIQN